MRLIDADVYKTRKLNKKKKYQFKTQGSPFPKSECDLFSAPTIESKVVIHSSWNLHTDGSATCKNCRQTIRYAWDFDNWMRYCPNCGANMEGEIK